MQTEDRHIRDAIDILYSRNLEGATETITMILGGGNSSRSLPGLETDTISLEDKKRSLLHEILVHAAGDSEDAHSIIRRAIAVRGDPQALVLAFVSGGLDELAKIGPELYCHVKPAKAYWIPSPEEISLFTWKSGLLLEPKLNGEELQIHIGPRGTRLFSRTGKDRTGRFRSLANAIDKAYDGLSAIIESEVVARAPNTGRLLPRTLLNRHGVVNQAVAYDLLLLGKADCTPQKCEDRFEMLMDLVGQKPLPNSNHGIVLTEQTKAFSKNDVLDYLQECRANRGLEGIIAKDTLAPYEAGQRTRKRMKIKPVDNMDAYVEGVNSSTGSILVSIRDPDLGKRIPCAWVSSITGETAAKLQGYATESIRPEFIAGKTLDRIFKDELIVEVGGNQREPSDKFVVGRRQTRRGWTLVGARILSIRSDLDVDDITTVEEFLKIPPIMGELGLPLVLPAVRDGTQLGLWYDD